jgi:hypothetical protein
LACVFALARVFAAGFFFAGAFLALAGAFFAAVFLAAALGAALLLASAMVFLLVGIAENGRECGVEN